MPIFWTDERSLDDLLREPDPDDLRGLAGGGRGFTLTQPGHEDRHLALPVLAVRHHAWRLTRQANDKLQDIS